MAVHSDIRRVLVPVDLEPGSDVVFAHALKLAHCSGAALTAVHVHDDPDRPVSWTALPTALDLLVAWGLLPPDATEGDVARLGLHVAREFRPGPDAANGLVEAVLDSLPNVIVVGTHRRKGLDRLRRGSVSEAVVRRSGAVALFVPTGVRPLIEPMTGHTRIHQVIFPVGGRTGDLQNALNVLANFLDILGVQEASLTVLHAGNTPHPSLVHPVRPGWTWLDVTRPGTVVDAIVGCARDRAADLVAMATRGHDSLADVLSGSLTEQVIRRAPCPVLAIPLGP